MARHIPYEENHRINNGVLEKKCSIHDIYSEGTEPWLSATSEYFYRNSSSPDGLSPYCIKCNKKKSDTWNKNNHEQRLTILKRSHKKEKFKADKREHEKRRRKSGKRKEWEQGNADKLKTYNENHRNHDITEKEWQGNQLAFNYCCAYCGKTKEEQLRQNKEQFHKDHVEHDGYNDVRNCCPACTQCNTSKHKDSIEEWYPKQEFYSQKNMDKIYWWRNEGYRGIIEDKPPYRILRKHNEDGRTYHHELWTVDEKRNIIECIASELKKRDLDVHIKNYLNSIISNDI